MRNHPYHLHPKPPRNRPTVKPNEGLLQRVAALPARKLPPQFSSSNSKGTRSIMFTSKEGSKKSSDSPGSIVWLW
eukprot:Gb_36062 [translate_table: standard]